MSTIAELEARVAQYKAELAEAQALGAIHKAQNATLPPAPASEPAKPVRLDLGCGKNKKEGFLGVDCLEFPGVDVRVSLAERNHMVPMTGEDLVTTKFYKPWPWNDSSVDEVHCAHTVEHLRFNPEYPERIHFANELWRVLKPGAKATIVVPHWASCRQYGDYTHREPVCEMWPWYLNKAWRASDAPHNTLYDCDFDCTTPGYSWHSALNHRNDEYRQYAMHWFKEAAQDMVFTLLCRK